MEGKVKVKLFNFLRQERFSNTDLQIFYSLYSKALLPIQNFLSNELSLDVNNIRLEIDQNTIGEIIESLPNPTNVIVLKLNDSDDKSLLEMDPYLTNKFFIDQEKHTNTETEKFNSFIKQLILIFENEWLHLFPIKFTLSEIFISSTPMNAKICSENEILLHAIIYLSIDNQEYSITFAIPYFHLFYFILPFLSQQGRIEPFTNTQKYSNNIKVEIGRIKIPIEQIKNLKPGSVFPIDIHPEYKLLVYRNDKCIGLAEGVILDNMVRGIRLLKLFEKKDFANFNNSDDNSYIVFFGTGATPEDCILDEGSIIELDETFKTHFDVLLSKDYYEAVNIWKGHDSLYGTIVHSVTQKANFVKSRMILNEGS